MTHRCTYISAYASPLLPGMLSSAYREEVHCIVTAWCADNNLSFKTSEKEGNHVDLRRGRGEHTALSIYSTAVERVSSFKADPRGPYHRALHLVSPHLPFYRKNPTTSPFSKETSKKTAVASWSCVAASRSSREALWLRPPSPQLQHVSIAC